MRREKGRRECYVTQDSISELNIEHFNAYSSKKTMHWGEKKSIYTEDPVSVVHNQSSLFSHRFNQGLYIKITWGNVTAIFQYIRMVSDG